MKIGEDGMKLSAKCVTNVIKNKSLLKKNSNLMKGNDCTITASISAQMFSVDIPDCNVKVDIPLQAMMHVINAANAKYRDLRETELGTPLGTK